MSNEREHYTMGYGHAATTIMAMRTAKSHAAFFVSQLKPGMRLLDCGCGPGTVTLGFAEIVAPGEVVGTEIEEAQVALASANASTRNVLNIRFEVANIYELPFEDASFDAVYISAVLGNLKEPLRGIREAHRVLKDSGVIGVKEFDHGGDILYPFDPSLEKYNEFYLRLRRENGHDPFGGRKIGAYLYEAGFNDVEMSMTYESYSDAQSLAGVAELNIGLLTDGWAEEFVSKGWATKRDIVEMTDAWRSFVEKKGAVFAVAWCEAVAHKFGVL